MLMRDETIELVEALPGGAKLNLILVNGANRILPMEPRGMVQADSKGKRRARSGPEDAC